MKQMSLGENGFERKTKRTRKREFLDEMNLVVPWGELVSLIAPHAPEPGAKGGRPPFAVETMLRIHFLQQWFNLSDPAMEEALYDTPMFREFAGLDAGEDRLPDESTILRFRHLLEAHNVTQAHALMHGQETDVLADAGYQGVDKRVETQGIDVNWLVAMRPGKRKTLDKNTSLGAILDQLEQAKARMRAKVEHPFRVIKRQFGHVKVRYRGMAKNTAQLHTLFALSNLWMMRRTLLQEMRA